MAPGNRGGRRNRPRPLYNIREGSHERSALTMTYTNALKAAIASGEMPVSLNTPEARGLLTVVLRSIDTMTEAQAEAVWKSWSSRVTDWSGDIVVSRPDILLSKQAARNITKLARNGAQTELLGWGEVIKGSGIMTPVIRVSR